MIGYLKTITQVALKIKAGAFYFEYAFDDTYISLI